MKRNRSLLVFALAAALAVACGVKSRPLPPQTVLPQPILDLHAQSVASGVQLSWGRPERYTGGGRMRDLGEFKVFRSVAGGAPVVIADLPLTDRQRFQQQRRFIFVDAQTALGQQYAYQVFSFTIDGYESPPSNVARTTRVKLKPPPDPNTFVLPTPSLPK